MGCSKSTSKHGPLKEAEEVQNAEPSPGRPRAGQRWRGVDVCSVYPLGADAKTLLVISEGSVVDFEGDAIVNAANEGCIIGGGVDGAVAKAGGPDLAQARLDLPVVDLARNTRCPTGEARMTIGGSLKVPHCIHAVGPDYNEMIYRRAMSLAECDALVAKTYRSALECAKEKPV